MKKKKLYIYIVIVVIILTLIGVITFKTLSNSNKFTSEERKWINSNINNVQNIYMAKDENLFSKNGSGVFYSFLSDFTKDYGVSFNVINSVDNLSELSLNKITSNEMIDNVFYIDHFVLVSNNYEFIKERNDLEKKTIGILNSDLEYVKKYLSDVVISYNGYDNEEELFKALTDGAINYVILPRITYIDKILSNNLEIIYHFSDIKLYYYLNTNDEVLSNILVKYFNTWNDSVNSYLKEEEFDLFKSNMNISDSDIDKLHSVDYKYGFINNSPYEVIMSGNYGGITAEYLKEFSEFSKVTFDITKYKNIDKLVKAINNGKVDLYFNYNNEIDSDYKSTSYGINSTLSIITRKDNSKVFNSVYGLSGEEVYVKKGSVLESYLNKLDNVIVKTYENNKELFKLVNKKDNDLIIVMDKYIYDFYSKLELKDYVSKYETVTQNKFDFKIKSDEVVLYNLLNKYISYLDKDDVINKGLFNHEEVVSKGEVLNNIAVYSILFILLILCVSLITYKRSKNIRIARRIRKDEKIRFIDDLTCLKNRSFLNDALKTWNNNTIYPQTIIVMDLNRLKEINDKHGVQEGDKQIQAAANALIKTQLDNSELMRSDGNEFVIYTVGYTQKQIVNYIHKLNKELKKLPYQYGAEFGYSFILNNLKTIEDALNEATLDMKEKKESGDSESKS